MSVDELALIFIAQRRSRGLRFRNRADIFVFTSLGIANGGHMSVGSAGFLFRLKVNDVVFVEQCT